MIIDKYIIKETGRISHLTITPGKPIKEEYKLFTINDEGYLYNYAWYSPIQKFEDRPKIKGLEDTSAIIFKLTLDTLSKDTILFIDNYFICPKLNITLKERGIAICETIKPDRRDLLKLLIEIKQEFIKNIPYNILTAVIQNNVLLVA